MVGSLISVKRNLNFSSKIYNKEEGFNYGDGTVQEHLMFVGLKVDAQDRFG